MTTNDEKFVSRSMVMKFQGVLFLSNIDMSSPAKIAVNLKESPKLPFNGLESILPIPADAPQEIPRIILNSKDGKFTCNIGLNRVDLFVNYKNPVTNNIDTDIQEVIKYLINIYSILVVRFDANSNRLAAVIETIEELTISSKTFLERTLLKDKLNDKTYTTQFNILFKDKLDSFEVNKWVKMTTLRNKTDLQNDKAVQINYDINTLKENQILVNSSSIEKFIKLSYKEIDLIKKDLFKI